MNNTTILSFGTNEVIIGADNLTKIKVWNLTRNTVTEYSLNSIERPAALWFLPRTRTIITAHTNIGRPGRTFKRWDLLTGKEISSFTIDQDVRDVAFSWDEHSLAIATSGTKIIVRNVATGHEEYSFVAAAGANWIQGLAIFPTGKLLANGSTQTPLIKVWDLATRQEVAVLRGHNLVVNGIAVSPDGQRLATSSIGHEPMKLWDTTGWEEVANLEVQGATLGVVGFLPDGNTLAALGTSGKIHLWRAPSMGEIEAAENAEKK